MASWKDGAASTQWVQLLGGLATIKGFVEAFVADIARPLPRFLPELIDWMSPYLIRGEDATESKALATVLAKKSPSTGWSTHTRISETGGMIYETTPEAAVAASEAIGELLALFVALAAARWSLPRERAETIFLLPLAEAPIVSQHQAIILEKMVFSSLYMRNLLVSSPSARDAIFQRIVWGYGLNCGRFSLVLDGLFVPKAWVGEESEAVFRTNFNRFNPCEDDGKEGSHNNNNNNNTAQTLDDGEEGVSNSALRAAALPDLFEKWTTDG